MYLADRVFPSFRMAPLRIRRPSVRSTVAVLTSGKAPQISFFVTGQRLLSTVRSTIAVLFIVRISR